MTDCMHTKAVCVFSLVLILVPAGLFAEESVDLVRDGQPAAMIVVDAQAPGMVRDAAALLQRVIEQSSGAKLAIVQPGAEGTDRSILRLTSNPGDRKLDKDGFVFTSPQANRIEIVGGSEHGTLFGTQDFLERYLGVRWLLPGDIGEHIPKHTTITVPRQEVKQEPAFFSRQLSGSSFRDKEISTFLLRQRMHGRMRFHHNLLHLYPVSKYAKTRPEFYPVLNGKRYAPKSNSDYRWQPNLSAEGIVEEGVKNICEFFEKHPDAESYSLGMNDSHAWDDSVTKAEEAKRNSISQIDLSDYFFDWANKIADGVLAKYPDKWFGCLAYNEVTDPPAHVGLNSRILPYVCIDRMYWADWRQRRRDVARTKAWMKVARKLAWYDYIYGDQFYKVPRFYPHLMGKYVRFAHEQGVVAYYAEAYPMPEWTEGPKLYVFLRLLWNPFLDVDATLDEWYRTTVGDRAAPHLARYYEFWEKFWTKRVPRTEWFKESAKATCYLHFNKADYLEKIRIGEDEYLDGLIEKVVDLSESPEQKKRAAFIQKGWESVRAEMSTYLEIQKLVKNGPSAGTKIEHAFSSDFETEKSAGLPAAGSRDDWKSAGMPKGWGHWQRSSSHATFGWDRRTGSESRGSLLLDASGSEGQPLCFLRTATVEPQTLYRVTCDIRTADTDKDASIGITIKWQDKNGKWSTRHATVDQHLEKPTRGRWKPVVGFVRTPAMEEPRLVYMLLVERTKKGRIWFDNVELSRLNKGEAE